MSLRNYITSDDLADVIDMADVSDPDLDEMISAAEEFIDDYVGAQDKFYSNEVTGQISAIVGKTIYDTNGTSPLIQLAQDYFLGCVIEIIGGTGIGQIQRITTSSRDDKSITVAEEWDTTPDSTSVYRLYQIGKFPRHKDVNTNADGTRYYKSIPQAVKQATIAQVRYMVEMGNDFFVGDDSEMQSESLGNYSYRRGGSGGTGNKLVGPRVKTLLKGIMNRKGVIIPERSSWL